MMERAAANIFIQEKHVTLQNVLIIAQVIWIKEHVIKKAKGEASLIFKN